MSKKELLAKAIKSIKEDDTSKAEQEKSINYVKGFSEDQLTEYLGGLAADKAEEEAEIENQDKQDEQHKPEEQAEPPTSDIFATTLARATELIINRNNKTKNENETAVIKLAELNLQQMKALVKELEEDQEQTGIMPSEDFQKKQDWESGKTTLTDEEKEKRKESIAETTKLFKLYRGMEDGEKERAITWLDKLHPEALERAAREIKEVIEIQNTKDAAAKKKEAQEEDQGKDDKETNSKKQIMACVECTFKTRKNISECPSCHVILVPWD